MRDFYPDDTDFGQILRLGFQADIKGTDFHTFEKREVCGIFNISEEKLDFYLHKLEIIARREGFKKGFVKCFDDGDVSIIGMYMLCYFFENEENELFRKYKNFFAEQSVRFAVKLIGNLPSDRTERRNRQKGSMPGLDYEDLMIMSSTKKIPSELKQVKEDVEDTSHFFYHKKVVITGSFEKFSFREEIAKLLYNVGADVNTSISKLTDYVIVGENAGPKKLEKIAQLGIETIDEKRFLEIFKLS